MNTKQKTVKLPLETITLRPDMGKSVEIAGVLIDRNYLKKTLTAALEAYKISPEGRAFEETGRAQAKAALAGNLTEEELLVDTMNDFMLSAMSSLARAILPGAHISFDIRPATKEFIAGMVAARALGDRGTSGFVHAAREALTKFTMKVEPIIRTSLEEIGIPMGSEFTSTVYKAMGMPN
jgi:hypothetical protein